MNEFIKMVLNELKQGIVQGISVAIIAGAVIAYAYAKHKEKYNGEKPFPWRKTILIFLLAGYLAVLGYATLSRLGGMGASGFSFHPFRAWWEAWNNFSVTSWANVLLNIAMLIPFGILIPLLFQQCKKWNYMLLASLGLVLYIETTQYLTGRGIFDIDDIFGNTLGAMIGYLLLMFVLSIFVEKEHRIRKVLGYGLLVMIPVAAICSILIAYNQQEYGNLPGAYTYRVNTSDIEWTLNCELSDTEQVVDMYKIDVPTQADIDVLRNEFELLLDEEFERTDYYDESIIYMNQWSDGPCSHFLTVQRNDGSYELSFIYDEEPTPAETNSETIERILAGYGINIPESAEFSYLHSGIHVFTIEDVADDSTIIRGRISCVYNEDGSLSKINNSLVYHSFHGNETIISENEAYEKLCRGEFHDETGVLGNTAEITVTSCTLDYQADTKGFYQPVFIFEVVPDSSEERLVIMIPALK
ncbi:MAG: VanZ family protein [Oscillospiraceae bacterium]|nr:VanZ family protein [Oscillospiraceae bacterium]